MTKPCPVPGCPYRDNDRCAYTGCPGAHRVPKPTSTITITGRYINNKPNMQEINPYTEEGRQIRKAFEEKLNKQLVDIDFSDLERRILALAKTELKKEPTK